MFKKAYLIYTALLLTVGLSLILSIGRIDAQDNSNCPVGQGYWKNTPSWPVTTIMLGSQTYTQVEALILLNTPPAGDASLILAHQLIAAKLNLAKGLDASVVSGVIAQGDAVLAGFTGRLPYNVPPSDANGQTLVNLGTILDSYNEGQLTVGCSLPATPTPTPVTTQESTPEATPESTATVTPVATMELTPEVTVVPGSPVIIVIEGPVQAININIITIYNINIQLDPNDPNLLIIKVGDIVHIEGTPTGNGNIIIIAVTVIIINVDVNPSTGDVWRDDDHGCGNPPPSWAPAHGWHRKCDNQNNQGNDKQDKKHNKHDDEDDD
jgi:hypothetical protein